MTPEDLAKVAEWERLAEHPSEDDCIVLVNQAVPEMARMIRDVLDGLATAGEQREKWRAVAEAWEARAHAALALADAATAEVKRLRDTHSPMSVEEVVAQLYERSADEPSWQPGVAKNLARWKMPNGDAASYDPSKCRHSMQDAYFKDTPAGRVHGCSDCDVDALPGRDRHGDVVIS